MIPSYNPCKPLTCISRILIHKFKFTFTLFITYIGRPEFREWESFNCECVECRIKGNDIEIVRIMYQCS